MSETTVATRPQAGQPAPSFALPDDRGTIRDLADERGRWVVLFFYPKDFTSGCTTEVCEFRDHHADFGAVAATVWGISVLDSESKAAFKARHGLDYPLLADEDHAVAELYGVWIEKSMYGKLYWGNERTTFVIDAGGVVTDVLRKVKPAQHDDLVLESLAG